MEPISYYYIDLDVIYHILSINIWYITKILLVAYLIFYILPSKIFPQESTGNGIQKVVFNFIYMIAYIELVLTFLIEIKAFSLLVFILSLALTKLAFLKWYYKKDLVDLFKRMRVSIMLFFLHLLDHPKEIRDNTYNTIKEWFNHIQEHISFYKFFRAALFTLAFFYIIAILMARGLLSYSDPLPDTSQFIEWAATLQQNVLFADNKSFGADFYGQAVIIFFVNLITNVDNIQLFSLFPILLLLALYLSIYYVVKDYSGSKYVGLFAVMVHGLVLMSPLADLILGKQYQITNPQLFDFYHLLFYVVPANISASLGHYNGNVPYLRYISGLAYEESSVFVLLNAYFLVKALDTKLNRYLIVYGLTLMLVFTFHGGGAIILSVMSILIATVAILFKKIDMKLLKKGLLIIIGASIIGNLWMLAMIKYGIPQDFGAAAPFIDTLLHTKNQMKHLQTLGMEYVTILDITFVHFFLLGLLALSFFIVIFTKRKFENLSILAIAAAVFISYFGPNAGLPLLADHSRQADYLFFAITLLSSFYFFFFVYKPSFFIFGKYAKYVIITLSYFIFLFAIIALPKWINSETFWKNINEIEYTSIPEEILQINDENRPFTWTVVAYVQSYAKVLNKGYHINSQTFFMDYPPTEHYLKIPTQKVYIVVENFTSNYMGLNEWYYRWRKIVQDNSKVWITLYSATHNNIRLYAKTSTVTIYEINNQEYIDKLWEAEKKKNDNL